MQYTCENSSRVRNYTKVRSTNAAQTQHKKSHNRLESRERERTGQREREREKRMGRLERERERGRRKRGGGAGERDYC